MEKNEIMAARGRLGGKKVLEKYGTDHFRALQRLSWARQIERDPKAGDRLYRAGLRAIDPVPENQAWTRDDWT